MIFFAKNLEIEIHSENAVFMLSLLHPCPKRLICEVEQGDVPLSSTVTVLLEMLAQKWPNFLP